MKPQSSMPKNADSPLPRSECLCSICRDIFLEPVTLPCNHTLCHPCFQMTVEKASLCCPFCRLRVSTWARYNTRKGTLVNQELWETIQHHYPEECKRRASGLDAEEDEFEDGSTTYPAPQLCEPGEIRQEYEQEICKIEAERLRTEEEEKKVSEEYIKKLLAEEEEEQRLSLERTQRELEEQLKEDAELARMLSSDLNESLASSIHVSPVTSPVIPKRPVGTKSCKNVKAKQKQSGDIERFLTPKNVNIASHVRNGDHLNTSIDMESVELVLDESDCDDSMPTLTPQSPFIANSCPMEVSDSEHKLPNLSKHSINKNALQSIGSETKEDTRQTMTTEFHEYSVTGDFSPPRCSRSLDCSGIWKLDMTSTPEQRHKVSPKRTLNFLGDEEDHHESEPSFLGNCIARGSHAERLKELEETLHEKKLQEEQDRLVALKLQKLLDKELKQVSRQKGSPDEYKLRSKRNTMAQESLEATPLKRPAPKRSAAEADSKSSESEESSDENKKPAPKKCEQSHQDGGRRARKSAKQSLHHGVKILKPSNKQKSILDMFQRYAKK